jgi:putative endonuclease
MLYCGVTLSRIRRIWEHRKGATSGFASRYDVGQLVWYEYHEDIAAAITRERAIKAWQRS